MPEDLTRAEIEEAITWAWAAGRPDIVDGFLDDLSALLASPVPA